VREHQIQNRVHSQAELLTEVFDFSADKYSGQIFSRSSLILLFFKFRLFYHSRTLPDTLESVPGNK
jgi:hypothetical protein